LLIKIGYARKSRGRVLADGVLLIKNLKTAYDPSPSPSMIQPVESWLRSTPVLMPPGCRLRRYKNPSYPGSEAVPQPLMLSFAQCADRQLFRCAEAPISHAGTDSHRRLGATQSRSPLSDLKPSWESTSALARLDTCSSAGPRPTCRRSSGRVTSAWLETPWQERFVAVA
jgi:hypothetical protein